MLSSDIAHPRLMQSRPVDSGTVLRGSPSITLGGPPSKSVVPLGQVFAKNRFNLSEMSNKKGRNLRPSGTLEKPLFAASFGSVLALRELEGLARLGAAVLLALD